MLKDSDHFLFPTELLVCSHLNGLPLHRSVLKQVTIGYTIYKLKSSVQYNE